MYGYKNTITETRPKAAQPVPKPVPIRVYMYISLYDALMVKGYLYTVCVYTCRCPFMMRSWLYVSSARYVYRYAICSSIY